MRSGSALVVVAIVSLAFVSLSAQAQPRSPRVTAVIEDLVVANRVLAAQGILPGYGHVSARNPDDPNHYFLARSLAPELVTAADIVEFDLDSKPVYGNAGSFYLERFIHGEIYRARPDVQAVVHDHSPGVIAFGAIWPLILATVHGFAVVEPRLYEVSLLLGMTRSQFIRKVALPSAMPDILAGMRISLTSSLILTIVGEILAGRDGIGFWVLLSSRSFRSADVFAGVILFGVIGYVSGQMLSLVESRLLRWRDATR